MGKELEIRHSILVVCYRQESFIEETLLSAIRQTERPHEVVVCDDCSPDKTWDIVKSLGQRYSDLLRIHRNPTNLGIFANLHHVRSLATGNVITFLSGDDLLKERTLESISESIRSQNLNPQLDKFIVALNSVHLYPDGTETIWNNYRRRFIDRFKLRLRYGLSYRGAGLSKPLVDAARTEHEILMQHPECGLAADWVKGFYEIDNATRIVFNPYAGPVYRLGTGITSSESLNQRELARKNALDVIESNWAEVWDESDRQYMNYIRTRQQYHARKTKLNFLKLLWAWWANRNNFDPNFPWIRAGNFLLPNRMLKFFKYTVYKNLQQRESITDKSTLVTQQ